MGRIETYSEGGKGLCEKSGIREADSLYILENGALFGVCLANIFSQSVACLFILLIVSFTEVLNFNEVKLTQFFFPGSCF